MDNLEKLIAKKSSEQWVQFQGIVVKMLPDKEIENVMRQRFVIADDDGLTVLVTLNLKELDWVKVEEGDQVSVQGNYVYDFRGGYIHHLYDKDERQGSVSIVKTKVIKYPRAYAANQLFHSQKSNHYLEVEGRVNKILADDLDRTPHQKFILSTQMNQTLEIVTNLDHMPKIDIATGDYMEVAGIYVWNKFGGLIHITHHDHFGNHPSGWIYFGREGRVYE